MLAKALKWKIYHFLFVFLRKRRCWAFLNTLQ
eukprot:UN25957